MKEKGKVPCSSEPELGFSTSSLPAPFSFLQTAAPLTSAPGEKITVSTARHRGEDTARNDPRMQRFGLFLTKCPVNSGD